MHSTNGKGFILSVHQFEGRIKVLNNKIDNNMVFIPSAIFTNFPKVNESHYHFNMDDFYSTNEESLEGHSTNE